MLLMGVKEENGWLCSQWNLTYGTGWTEITKAVKTAYPCYENVEVLVDNIKVDLQSAEEVLCLEEGGDMVIRGDFHSHQSADDGQVLQSAADGGCMGGVCHR